MVKVRLIIKSAGRTNRGKWQMLKKNYFKLCLTENHLLIINALNIDIKPNSS